MPNCIRLSDHIQTSTMISFGLCLFCLMIWSAFGPSGPSGRRLSSVFVGASASTMLPSVEFFLSTCRVLRGLLGEIG